jgi:hypothetical protein
MGKPIPGQEKVTTVWLEPEIGPDGDRTKMFFCFNCRIPLIQYVGDVVTIVPGGSPYQPSTVLKCKGSVQTPDGSWEACGHKYCFISAVYTKNPSMT